MTQDEWEVDAAMADRRRLNDARELLAVARELFTQLDNPPVDESKVRALSLQIRDLARDIAGEA